MRTDDASYYRERARQERERAATCEDNAVALAHLKMAEAYDKRVEMIERPATARSPVATVVQFPQAT